MRFLLRRIAAGALLWITIGAEVSASEQDWFASQSMDSLALNDTSRLTDDRHNAAVFNVLRNATLRELGLDSSLRFQDHQWNKARMRAALRLFGDLTVRDLWLREIARDVIDNFGIKNASELLDTFYEYCRDSAYVSEIRRSAESESVARSAHEIRPYKTIGPSTLDAHIFRPSGHESAGARPAIVLFHGGSWYQGKPDWMYARCERFSQLGLVALSIEYRLYDRHGVSPLECISDARSAIRWVREHADELGVDPARIAAGGFSAGGHIAACSASLAILDEAGENGSVSSSPNALLLYSACFDPTLDPWFVKQVESRIPAEQCSPLHTVRRGMPPTLIVHGTADRMCPHRTAEAFRDSMIFRENKCFITALEGAEHFYFFNSEHSATARAATDDFLREIGYLGGR